MVNGRTALVTGAASGIGKAIAAALTEQGYRVLGLDVSEGPDIIRADIAVENDVERATASVVDRFGHIDVLVNAAGILREGPVSTFSTADFDKLFAVNMRGTFLVTRSFLPHLAEGSAIINIASELAYLGREQAAAYAATKGAILSWTRSLARELAPRTRVNAIAPGPVDTPLLGYNKMTPDQQRLETNNPMGRIGKPHEVAAVAVFLAGPSASFVTGQCYSVDGGAGMH
jgi:3-oxoacyl-[acyl-carrier protein] reductase